MSLLTGDIIHQLTSQKNFSLIQKINVLLILKFQKKFSNIKKINLINF